MEPLLDSRQLRSAGRRVPSAFRIRVLCRDSIDELTCTRLLRVLPGKRVVCAGRWKGLPVVAKIYLQSARAARLQSAREMAGVEALQKAGVLTPALRCVGRIDPDGAPLLGFQYLSGSTRFGDRWKSAASEPERRRLLGRLLETVAALHQAGLKQDDLHLGNLLVAGEEIYCLDGDTVDTRRQGNPLPERVSLSNLGLLLAQFGPPAASLFREALTRYLICRAWPFEERLLADLLAQVRRHQARRENKVLRKIFRNTSSLACSRAWGRYEVWDRSFASEGFAALRADPDAGMDAGTLLKAGNTATVALVRADGQGLVVKRYNIKGPWHALKRALRPSRAARAWRHAHRLTLREIPTPRPVALIEKRWGPLRRSAYLITEQVEGQDLQQLLGPGNLRGSEAGRSAELFVELVRSLCLASSSHGDFKATNFVLSGDRLYLMDLDAMRRHRSRRRFRRAIQKDLTRFLDNWRALPEVRRQFAEKLQDLLARLPAERQEIAK